MRHFEKLIPFVCENFITIPLWEEGDYTPCLNIWLHFDFDKLPASIINHNPLGIFENDFRNANILAIPEIRLVKKGEVDLFEEILPVPKSSYFEVAFLISSKIKEVNIDKLIAAALIIIGTYKSKINP